MHCAFLGLNICFRAYPLHLIPSKVPMVDSNSIQCTTCYSGIPVKLSRVLFTLHALIRSDSRIYLRKIWAKDRNLASALSGPYLSNSYFHNESVLQIILCSVEKQKYKLPLEITSGKELWRAKIGVFNTLYIFCQIQGIVTISWKSQTLEICRC